MDDSAQKPGPSLASLLARLLENARPDHVGEPAHDARSQVDPAREPVDEETLARARRIRQVLEGRVQATLQASGSPRPDAPEARPVPRPAPPRPGRPEPGHRPGALTAEDKLRMLRAYNEARKARLKQRSELLWPRHPGVAQRDASQEPGWSVHLDDAALTIESSLHLDSQAIALDSGRLHLGDAALRRSRRALSIDPGRKP